MLIIASDHAGFKLKQKLVAWLKNQNLDVVDCGALQYQSMDSYVDYAKKAIDYFL